MSSTKEFREKHGLTQAKLAELLPCSKRAIECWEGGQRKPPAYLARALAHLAQERINGDNHCTDE